MITTTATVLIPTEMDAAPGSVRKLKTTTAGLNQTITITSRNGRLKTMKNTSRMIMALVSEIKVIAIKKSS